MFIEREAQRRNKGDLGCLASNATKRVRHELDICIGDGCNTSSCLSA